VGSTTEQAYEASAYEALRVLAATPGCIRALPEGRLKKSPIVVGAAAKLRQVAGVTASPSFDRATSPSAERPIASFDGALEIGNNAAERALRVVALGRKTFCTSAFTAAANELS